jgi:hypothetical protein
MRPYAVRQRSKHERAGQIRLDISMCSYRCSSSSALLAQARASALLLLLLLLPFVNLLNCHSWPLPQLPVQQAIPLLTAAARLVLRIKSLQALPVSDKPFISAVDQLYVLLQVCCCDWRVLCWVQGRRLRQLRGIMTKSPETPARLMRRARVIDYGSQRLPHGVHTAVDVIVQHASTLRSSA